MAYSCIVVDDDDIDRLTTLSHVKRHPLFDVTGVYSSAEEALHGIQNQLPSVIFLDIDMPGMSGLELRKELLRVPACIFVTAFSDYAAEGFDLEALDFIVKPIRTERFDRTAERIGTYFSTREKALLYEHELGGDFIFIKEGSGQVRLALHEILYLEALGDFTLVVTSKKKHCVYSNLGALLKEKGFTSFIRIHKSYAVQKHAIVRIKSDEVFIKDISLPVGRTYREVLNILR